MRSTVLLVLFAILAAVAASVHRRHHHPNIEYSTVVGYFLQDLNSTNATGFDYTKVNFGLVNQTYQGGSSRGTQWQKFARELTRLQKEAPRNVGYKLLFLGRHGEGWHNAAETFYGTPAWNCYWSLIAGNGTAYWEDAHLTDAGIKQAQVARDYWKSRIALQKIPVPGSFYSSPLARCLATANITFGSIDFQGKTEFEPTVKEYLREGVSLHLCDHRSNRTWIESEYPDFEIEEGFAEYDPLFNGVTAETPDAQDVRSKAVLDDIFSSDDSQYISVTSHSGEIASILRVVQHRTFSLSTGGIIPVLVKAEWTDAEPSPISATWSVSAHCTTPPLSSLSVGGCVCPSSAPPITTPLVTETPVVKPIATFTPTLGY